MCFLHSRGVIHRDLKLENVLVDEHFHAQLADFGNARIAGTGAAMTSAVGTPLYMPPEMYEEGQYTDAVDVYTFVLILYELLVGEPVFSPRTGSLVLMKKVASDQRPKIPGLMRAEVGDIIANGWAVDALKRGTFDGILATLQKVQFKITPKVNKGRVIAFAASVTIGRSST